MTRKNWKSYQTQWAGQFGVAHEMTRRGYTVAFTMGNTPNTDLLCKSPKGYAFSIQVKSLSSKSYFLYQESLLTSYPSLYFIFVLVPGKILQSPEYFVLSNEQFLRTIKEENQRLKEEERKRGKPYAKFTPGISYHTINRDEFHSAWHNLPE